MKKQQTSSSNRIQVVLPSGFKTMPERSASLDLKAINKKLSAMQESTNPTQSAAYIDHGCGRLHAFVKKCLGSGLKQISVRVVGKKNEGDGSCGPAYYVAYSAPGESSERFTVSHKCLDTLEKVPPERVIFEPVLAPVVQRQSVSAGAAIA